MVAHLDVAITRLGTVGLDAKGQDGVGALYEFEGFQHAVPEAVGLEHQVIAGSHHNLGLGVQGMNVIGRPGDAGRRVASAGLQQDLLGAHVGKLLTDDGSILLVGEHVDILWLHDTLDAVHRHLQQAAAGAQKIEKLLGLVLTAVRPETASHAATHDDAITMVVH